MWLINARILTLEEVWDEADREYAILSHRWEEEEVSFKDMQNLEVATKKKGFLKIAKSCELALKDNYSYVWVDTCCINKESSAELSEAINSMYRWYQSSSVCYAFLSDVDHGAPDSGTLEQQIEESLWFDRGWTLQELLAPSHLIFYDRSWRYIDTKRAMSEMLMRRTGIDSLALEGENSLEAYSIAQRMSWASRRVTTRKEDIGYCLLGIFGVNMPMLYGEGTKAFMRLQEEIIKQSDDHTIFAWPIHREEQVGLLADSPAAFAGCQNVRVLSSGKGRSAYSMTNRGLSCEFIAKPYSPNTYFVRLDCENIDMADYHLGMFLRRLSEDDQYARVTVEGHTFIKATASEWDMSPRLSHTVWDTLDLDDIHRVIRTHIEVNVRQAIPKKDLEWIQGFVNGFRLVTPKNVKPLNAFEGIPTTPSDCIWNPRTSRMQIPPGEYGYVGTLDVSAHCRNMQRVLLGFDFDYNPVCFVLGHNQLGGKSRQATTKEIVFFDYFKQRPFLGIIDWSQVDQGQAWDLEKHRDIWALKGDRVNGIDVSLKSRSRGHFYDIGKITISRAQVSDNDRNDHGKSFEAENKWVWDVHIKFSKR
ncbi:MAG: hypothetical protein Q9213_005283 [Squamulea squamosa]